MLVGALVIAGVSFTIGVFLWCKNGIKQKEKSYIDEDI